MAYSLGPTEVLTVSTGGSVSTAIVVVPSIMRIVSDVPVHVSTDGPANTNDAYIPANTEFLVSVQVGSSVSVLGTAAGTAWVTYINEA